VLLRYYALNTPFLFLQVAPFVTTVAALFTLAKLIRHNELVASLNAGVSAQRLLLPVYAGALLAAGGMFALRETVTPAIGDRRDALRDRLEYRREARVLEDVTIRDLAGNEVMIGEFDAGAAAIRRLQVGAVRGKRLLFITATEAEFALRPDGEAGWRLRDGRLRELAGHEASTRELEWLELVTFAPRDVKLAHKGENAPLELSFAELDELSARDPSNLEYQTLFHYLLTFPLSNVVLVLLTMPFLLGRDRGKHIAGVAAAASACVAYVAFDFICRSFGMEGALSPLWAAWLPVLLGGSLGAALTESARS
jgi:lipopolysaccharide export system permease protein